MAWDRSSLTLAPRNINDNFIANESCWNDGGSAQKRLARQLVCRFSLRHSFLSGLSYSSHHRICRCDNTFKTFSLGNRIRPLTFPNIQPYCRCVKQTTYLFTIPALRGYQQSRILSSTSFKDAWLAEEGTLENSLPNVPRFLSWGTLEISSRKSLQMVKTALQWV